MKQMFIGERRTRLRARASAVGALRAGPAASLSAMRRRRILASTRGTGPIPDRLLDEERDRI